MPTGLKLGKEAQAKFDEAKTAPDFQGFLDKKGAKRKNWNNRWFVLKDNYLFYCKTTKSRPQGIINLHGCTVSPLEGPTARPYSFSVLAPKSVSVDAKWTNRTYFFAATSSGELQEWTKVLVDAGKRAVERSQQKAASAPHSPEVIKKEVKEKEEKSSASEDSDDGSDASDDGSEKTEEPEPTEKAKKKKSKKKVEEKPDDE